MDYDEAKKCFNDAKAKELIRHPNLLKYVSIYINIFIFRLFYGLIK